MNQGKLFNKNFTLIIIGQLISMFGNSIQRFAFSLYILKLTGSAAIFSLIISLAILPTILLSPIGGAIADRKNKGNIMVILDFICGILIAIFTIFIYGTNHQILFIAMLMFTLSIMNSIYEPTVRASIPIISSKENLNAANSIVSQISALTGLLGPIAAGFLFGFFGIRVVMVINLISFIIAAIMELFLKIPYTKVTKENGSALKSYLTDIKGSISFLFHEKPLVFYMIILASGANLFLTPLYTVGFPYVQKIVLGVTDQMYGISEAILGIGMILGAILSTSLAKKIPFEKIYFHFSFISITVLGMGIFITPWFLKGSQPHMISFWIFTLFGFILMFIMANINIQAMTFIQLQVPDNIMGKCMALVSALATAFMPMGQIIFGQLYDKLNDFILIVYVIVMFFTFGCAKVVKYLINTHYHKHSSKDLQVNEYL